jgi:co-chaperonin GroES (HSP10)
MSYIKLNYINPTQAKEFSGIFENIGTPTEDRVLIMTPNKEEVKVGSIILPNQTESLPRKGVVISIGPISEACQSYRAIDIGHVVTYGLYAGKEVEFNPEAFPKELRPLLKTNTFSVLSLNEVIFIEVNSSK